MRQQLEQILVYGTLGFLLGCHLGLSKIISLWAAVSLGVVFSLLLIGACCKYWESKILAVLAVGVFFCCGAAVGSGAMRQAQLEIGSFTGQQVLLYGTSEPGSVKNRPEGTSLVLVCNAVQAESVAADTSLLPAAAKDSFNTIAAPTSRTATAVAGKVRVFIKKVQLADKLAGQLTVSGTLKPLTNFANPGGWDGELWNELQGLQGRMSVSGSEVYLSGGSPGISDRIAGLANTLRQQLQSTAPGQAGAVLAGMTLGGYDGISAETRDDFARVGLAHLLAVSGTHIALLTGFLLLVLRRRNRYTLLVVAAILLFYAALCGFKPPVLRALCMSLALFATCGSDRLPQRSNIFCGVVLLLLCYQPCWLWDVGFQLSFVTTAGLLYFYPVLSGVCARYMPVAAAEVLAVSLTAQLAALPFLVHYFHQLSLAGLAANLFLVPLLEIAVLLTLAGFALLPLLGLGKLLFVLAGTLLLPLLKLIGWLAAWNWSSVTVGNWPYLCSAIYYLLLLLVLGNSDWDDFSNKERRLLIACCCFTLVGIGVYDKVRPQPLTVHFIDVGQGDAALVITPQRQTLLIDSGGLRGDYDTGRRIILPYLRYLGIRSLDVMLLSHGHHDHAGGAAAVAQNLPIGKIILPQEPPAADVQALLRNTKAQVEHAQTGSNYSLGNTELQIVSAPVSSSTAGDANESSLIVRVASAGGSIVFTGDATEDEELLAAGQIQPSQVLKVSHHGSDHSSCMPFLTAVRPQIAVISVGAGNSYGHPGSAVLQRLAAVGSQVWRTDLGGAIKITFDGGTVKCYSYRYQKEYF